MASTSASKPDNAGSIPAAPAIQKLLEDHIMTWVNKRKNQLVKCSCGWKTIIKAPTSKMVKNKKYDKNQKHDFNAVKCDPRYNQHRAECPRDCW